MTETRGFCKEILGDTDAILGTLMQSWGHWCNFGSNPCLVFFQDSGIRMVAVPLSLRRIVGKSSTFFFGGGNTFFFFHNFHVLGLCHTLPFGQQTMTMTTSPFCLCLLRPLRCLPQGTRRSKMKRFWFFCGRKTSSSEGKFIKGLTISKQLHF